jgi:hypothetical protein
MRFWLREVAGWGLVLLGLFLFYYAFELVTLNRILYVWPVVIIGIFVFRGGIHLLKIAVAARVCLQTQDRLYSAPPPGRKLGT